MGVKLEDIVKAARDGITTSVGLGVLLYQRAQVYRRELERTVNKVAYEVAAEFDGRRNNRRDAD